MKAEIGHNSNALKDIATRARLALEQVDAGEKLTMEGWLQYGTAMNEGREMFPGDKEFGEWVAESQLDCAHQKEREAAMWAAANPKEFEATKEANPRVRTVRGLHAKWKEEQKANQTAKAEYGVVHDVAATEAPKVCNVDDAILEFNNLSDEGKVERLGGKAKVDAARQRKLDETLESDYDPSNGATSMLITLHRLWLYGQKSENGQKDEITRHLLCELEGSVRMRKYKADALLLLAEIIEEHRVEISSYAKERQQLKIVN